MITRVHKGGGTFGGLASYLTQGDRHDGIELVNLAAQDARTAARVMQATVAHAPLLKELAGRSKRGRKLEKPAHHFSASWDPEDDATNEEMFTFGRRCLKALGFEDRQALMVVHRDKTTADGRARAELHVMSNRVSHEDGTAAPDRYDATRLAAVSREYEQEQGQIRVPSRLKRLPSGERQRKRLRTRGGRAVDMSPGERRAFTTLKTTHTKKRVPVAQRRAERRELGRRLTQRRTATLAAAGHETVLEVDLAPTPARPRGRAVLRPTPAAPVLEVEIPPTPARPRGRAVLQPTPAAPVLEVDLPPRPRPRPRTVERPPATPATAPARLPVTRRLSPEEIAAEEDRRLAAWEQEQAEAAGPPATPSTEQSPAAPATPSTERSPAPAPAPAGSLGRPVYPVQQDQHDQPRPQRDRRRKRHD